MLLARLGPFLLGAMSVANAVVALFFLRYFRDTKDTLFLYFAAAFGLETINRAVLAFAATPNEASPAIYVLRAFAYSLILLGIYRKNL
jgi:hypothetical protein